MATRLYHGKEFQSENHLGDKTWDNLKIGIEAMKAQKLLGGLSQIEIDHSQHHCDAKRVGGELL